MIRRRMLSIAGALVTTPLALTVLPPATASAHGYVSSPPSRQAQCASGVVSCGAVQYEPQSVEGPKGLHNCSGNKYPELDDDSLGWAAQPVGSSVDFSWTFTANHRTLNWQYYIGDTLLDTIPGNNEQPPMSGVTHHIDLGGFTGRQKLLAVWNIGDTANAFYSCVDLDISGGTGGAPTGTTVVTTTTAAPPTSTAPATTAPATTTAVSPTPTPSPTRTRPPRPTTTTAQPASNAWHVGAYYRAGDLVTYDDMTYRCLQSHTVYDPGWTPEAAPALWEMVM